MTPDSEGLHEIANTTNRDRKADIVFVHGLGGSSHGTWRHGKEGKSGHFFWPEELGKDLPHCGIWSVGYPAGFTALGKPGMIIEKRAGNLSQKLANAGLGVRPLLFITHSMGGLVVKSLIVGSQTLADADRKRLVSVIRGIVFCATPHRGSAFADAAGVLGTFFGGSQDHVDQMRANAEPLDILHDQFIEWHRIHQVPIESYAENIGLFKTRWFLHPLPLGLVVPRPSANPGIAGHTVRDVDDDHLTLVKPKDRQHDVYAGVLRFIRDALTVVSSERANVTPASRPPLVPATQSAINTITGVGRPRVYLSYTLRTHGLREKVFDLAEKLRENGIDSRMDLYYAKSLHGFTPPDPLPNRDSWEAWQEDEIRDADCMLVVCSREYIESPENSGAWRDVDFMKKNMESGGAALRKFIPVGFGAYEVNSQFIPSFIRGATYYDLTPGTSTGFGFEDLVRRFRTEFPPGGGAVQELLSGVKSKASSERRQRVQSNQSSQVMSEITVFISYSHDSDEHRQRVLALSERLRADGIETLLDQYVNGSPQQGWPRWMLDQLDAADSVLVVCTETYYRRFRGHEEPGKGKGVDWEGALITQEIYASRSRTLKFVPVFLSAAVENWIPEPLRSGNYYALTSESDYEHLYDFLLEQAGVEPGPVGKPRRKARKQVARLNFGDKAASGHRSPQAASLTPSTTLPATPSLQALKVLIVSASPKDRDTLGVDVEIREIRQAVKAARFRDNLQIVVETAVLADEFANCLRDHAPQILHFSGYHSDPGGIMLMDENDHSKPVLREALLHVLRGQTGLRMVVLNTCFSLAGAEALAREIDFVIGVEADLDDKASIQFARCFYGALANGHSVQSAFDQAITPMIGNCPKENIPQLRSNKRTNASEVVLIEHSSLRAGLSPVSMDPDAPASNALKTWQKKLAFLQVEEAKAVDAEQKFSIQQRIEEARAKIQELGG